MKKTILIATLALLLSAPTAANAQIFLTCSTPCVCYRVGFFQLCRAWRPRAWARCMPAETRLEIERANAADYSGRLVGRPSCCNDQNCAAEYVPTTEGNVPAHEYLEAKKNGGAPIATTFMAAANRIRARYGLPELTLDANLCAGCARQANYCASVGALIHGGGAAEILAQNVSGFDFALNQWLASPAHRAILLSGQYRVAGIAVVRDRNGRVWCSMRFR